MSKHIDFRKVTPDEESLYVTKELRINGKKIITPIKSLNLSKSNSNLQFNDKTRGINEIYKRFSLNKSTKKNSIYNLLSIPDKLTKFNYELNSLVRKTNHDSEINICFMEYDGVKYPEKKSLDFMVDTAYEYSDITPLPIIPKIPERIGSDEREFIKYTNFLTESIETIETLNNQPIIGIVPPVQFFINDIVEFYAKKEIDAFVFDCDGKTPMSLHQTIRGFMRSLKQHDLLENSFIHLINANQGRFNKDSNVVGAKDILSFGLGFDSMGEKHKPLKGPKEFFDKLKNREDNKLRLFNKEDYGYYKLSASEIGDIYPIDSIISTKDFENEQTDVRNLQKSFNLEQVGLEAIRLRSVIDDQESLKYLSNKSQVKKEDFKKIAKMKKFVSTQSSLSKYL